MQIQQGFADVNGTRLYYEMAGSGHPLVLVHKKQRDVQVSRNRGTQYHFASSPRIV